MKINLYITLSIILLSLMSGSCKPKMSTDEECDRNIQQANIFFDSYFENGDPIFLDSTMFYIEKVDCDTYIGIVTIGKAYVYSLKGRFRDAIECMESIPETFIEPSILKSILIWELESKWAKAEGDNDKEMDVYKRQDAVLWERIHEKWPQYDSMLRTIVETVRISNSEAELVVREYFRNKMKLTNCNIVLSEIDSMHKLVKGGDPFFEELRMDISGDPEYYCDPDFFSDYNE